MFLAFFTLTSSSSLPEKWIIEILRILIHGELLEGPSAAAGWKLRCTIVLLWESVMGRSGPALKGHKVWPLLLFHILLPVCDENLSGHQK